MPRIIGEVDEWRVEREVWGNQYAFRFGTMQRGGAWAIATDINMEGIAAGAYTPPFLRCEVGAAQQLLDELWRTGLRPSNPLEAATLNITGEVVAQRLHIADLQRIIFEDPFGRRNT
jgi:hypothetical protein